MKPAAPVIRILFGLNMRSLGLFLDRINRILRIYEKGSSLPLTLGNSFRIYNGGSR